MKKFSGVGRGLFIQPSSTDPEVGRASSSSIGEDPTSPGLPELVSHQEDDVNGDGKNSPEPVASPMESTEHSCAGDIHVNAEEDTLKFLEDTEEPLNSPGPHPPDQNSNATAIDNALESRELEAAETLHVEDDVTTPPLVDHASVESDLSFTVEPSTSPTNQDKAPECDQSVPSAEVPLPETKESSSIDGNASEERAEGDDISDVGYVNEKSPDCSLLVTSNEDGSVEQSSEDCAKDNEKDSAKVENELTDKKNNAEKSRIQIAANLNPTAPTTKSSKTSPDIPLLPSPMKAPGMGILGPAPNAPLLPRGPPSMFPKALPISIPPPPLDLRMPPPKVVPKTKEELLQILTEQVGIIQPPDEKSSGDQGRGKTVPKMKKELFRMPPSKFVPTTKEELLQLLTEQVGIIQPPDEKGSEDQGRGKTAPSDDQNPKQQSKKQQYPQRQQQQQQQQQQPPGQQWQNTGRDNNWRQKTDVKGQTPPPSNMRGQQPGMPNIQNRQPNAAGKKPSPQAGTKPGLSNLTKDELEKEYQWQKFSVERKIKKVLKSLKTNTDEDVIKELLAVIKLNPSKLANFPWPKEQYVVLEKLIEHAILNTDGDESLQKRIATIINSLQDMHPQGFKEDLKNAIVHEQGVYIQGTSSEFRRKQARSAGHFLGELYSLSRTSSTEFKASVQSVVTLTLKDWIKAPNITTVNDDGKLLLEVYGECLEEFLILTLRDNDESLKKQVSSWLKEEILSTTRPKEAKTVLLDTLFKLACHRCTAGVPVEVQKNQQSPENREPKRNSSSSVPSPGKVMSSTPQQPKVQPVSLPKPNTQQDVKQPAQQQPAQQQQQQQQQQQHRQQQQHLSLQGSKFMSPPPSGMPQVPGRLPPGQHQMNFQQAGSVNMSVPPPNMSQPGQWPVVSSQSLQMQGSMQAAPTGTGVVLPNHLQQQQQLQQQTGYMPQSIPASMQAPQGSVPMPQPQITQSGNQRHTHGLGATMQMLQQAAFQDSQGMPSQQVRGNLVPQAPSGIPLSQTSNIPSMMHSISQTNPQMMSGVPAQQMMQPGNVQAMQFSSAGTTPGHPAQSSSQFLRNLPMSLAQQMNSSMNYQQQEELVNQMGHMVLSGSDPWQQSGVGVTQALTQPIFSTAHGVNPSVNRQEMLTALQGGNPVQPSQEDVSGHSSFAHSAVSGRFVQNSMPEAAAPKQGFQQNNDETMHGLGQWGMSPQGAAWPDKLPDSTQLPTTSPPSFTSQNQTPPQWTADSRNVKSPEAVNDASPQEPSGWGDTNPGPQEPSQQRLGTDGWGTSSSTSSQNIPSWGTDPQATDSWNGHANPFPGHDIASYQPGTVQQNSAEHSEMGGPRGFQHQQRMPKQIQGPPNAIKNHSTDKYVFEESASSVGGYQRPNAYTLPSKHKEGSPAAEGVSYNAMSELGSYGLDPGNSYDSSSYGGGYPTIRDGGGYGDSIPQGGQKVGNFVLLPQDKSPQNSTSPDHFEISAIRDCFMDDEDVSSYELNAYQNQLRHRQEHGRPNWSQFQTPKEKQMPSALSSRSPREISRRGQGRGSLLVTNPCTAMPPFPASHPPGSRQPPNKQKYPPRS